jgi:cytochrome b561
MPTNWRNTSKAWGIVAKSFHWIVALLILTQFALGNIAENMKLSPAKIDAFVWHKSIGVTILLLALLRLAWRAANPPPITPHDTPAWETKLAAAGHWLLYGLMIAVPISGWIVSDASRVPFEGFFIVPMPDLIETTRELQEEAEDVHELLTKALIAVVLVHIAAALRHHFMLRNDVLRRMLPGSRKS